MVKTGYLAVTEETFEHWLLMPRVMKEAVFYESEVVAIDAACAAGARRPWVFTDSDFQSAGFIPADYFGSSQGPNPLLVEHGGAQSVTHSCALNLSTVLLLRSHLLSHMNSRTLDSNLVPHFHGATS